MSVKIPNAKVVEVVVQNPLKNPEVKCVPDRLILVDDPDDVTILFKLVTPQFVFPVDPEEAIQFEDNNGTFHGFSTVNPTEILMTDNNYKDAKKKRFKYLAKVISNTGKEYEVDPLIVNK